MLNKLQQMHLKLLQKEQFKKNSRSGDSIGGNKIADNITKVSKTSLKTFKNETKNMDVVEK